MASDGFLIGKGVTVNNTVTTTATNASVGGTNNHGVLFVSYDPGVTITSIPADSKGNTGYVLQWLITVGRARIACYLFENWAGGSGHTVTINFSGDSFAVAHLCEARDVASSSSVDLVVTSAVAGVANTPAVGTSRFQQTTGAFAAAGELVFFFLEANTGNPGAYSSPDLTMLSSEPDVNTYWTSGVGKMVTSSTSAVTRTIDVAARDATAANGFGVIAFKINAGGGGGSSAPAAYHLQQQQG